MPRRSTSNALKGDGPARIGSRSTTTASWPARATASAAASPATPPPATTSFIGRSYLTGDGACSAENYGQRGGMAPDSGSPRAAYGAVMRRIVLPLLAVAVLVSTADAG